MKYCVLGVFRLNTSISSAEFKVRMKVVPKFRPSNGTRDQARVIHVAIVLDEQFSRCVLSLGHSLYSTPMSSVCERAGSEWSRDMLRAGTRAQILPQRIY